jgi:phosphohistidine phosphatase
MPSLLLLRHAKSDWTADDAEHDRLRPLAPRGEKAAKRMGRFMARSGQVPDSAIVSPARRAWDTLQLAMAAGDWSCPTRSADPLYGAGVRGLLGEIRAEPATTELLLAVGHEPTWSETAALLIGGGHLGFPSAALARIDFEINRWDEVRPGTGVLAWTVVPRLLTKRPR